MQLNQKTIDFITDNLNADTNRLLLSAKKYPDIDMDFAANQILARRQIREKLPQWFANKQIILPSRLSAEQCSSQLTAQYKQRLLQGDSLCDLTGGLGIDSYYFSLKTRESVYIERFENYCQAAINNFRALGADNIKVICGDSRQVLDSISQIDCFYIDPARRGDLNKRIYAIEDCEPNVVELSDILLSKARRLIVKISPMADISNTLKMLPRTTEIHVVSVKNECKELLLIIDRESMESAPTRIVCVNFTASGYEERFEFMANEEISADVEYCNKTLTYLYEPNASVMKAGAFRIAASHFKLKKLHPSSHLYTGEKIIEDFPGRKFEVIEQIDYSSKSVKQFASIIPQANITTRNFPLSVEEIRKKTKIREGGDTYLFATTMNDGNKVILKCKKLQ